MKRWMLAATLLIGAPWLTDTVRAFCGFYVAKADTRLFNRASQVVLVRDGDRTVLTMANDFKGAPKEFAVVIPVPTFIERGQIHVAEKALIDRLDAYSAPRLVEYFDENPCDPRIYPMATVGGARRDDMASVGGSARAKALGVTIEAQYTVGEYDILILSAKESSGLETWLTTNGYRIPSGAGAILGSYLRQNMRFFVAKVNLGEQTKLGFSYLRPLQLAYESPKFMLPIRLGIVNADGPQELFVYALTRKGRVETTNYRTVKLPTGMTLPAYVKDDFGSFYKALFTEQTRREAHSAVFLEYAWDMAWCDPCAADPLTSEELRSLGVFWPNQTGVPQPMPRSGPIPQILRTPGPQNAFVTRLHVRYDNAHFPEDLVFQETADRQNFQGRYVLQHPWQGADTCEAATRYRTTLQERHEREAQTLATLTGWNVNDVRKRMQLPPRRADAQPARWWEALWK
jgi:hypothetical protein